MTRNSVKALLSTITITRANQYCETILYTRYLFYSIFIYFLLQIDGFGLYYHTCTYKYVIILNFNLLLIT